MYQPQLDRVLAWASGPDRQEEILRAKAAFFERIGEAHEEDRSFEQRLALFVEHFLFDRPLDGTGAPPAAAYLEANRAALSPEELGTFEALTRSVHGIFEVRKLGTKLGLKVRDVVSRTDYDILERRGLVALSKGDILDARLLPIDGNLVFSGHFLYHPAEARKAILTEAKRRKKADPTASSSELAYDLARLALKLDRYRGVPVENIYKFG
ncbi:hypothetical protein [Vulgatibacter incomptus]|uniref:Uncharacterized protein n=1 Tax=Vulgatibacter incomptus TaxID=1391653 RepID=A0A0K1PC78_9BACT|nr:hypothetical protein [Vulgatibacter incomptus]AKU91021.1 hypothetical protein AKJ08_1408 [Vulgatibacter incomptus]